jgi:hypothetical protein
MKMTDIQIINFGLDAQFKNTERLIKFRYDMESPAQEYEINFRWALNEQKLVSLLSETSFLGHVMSHGTRDGKLHALFGLLQADASNFTCTDERFPILNMDGLLLDACQTFSKTWIRKIKTSLPPRKSIVLIGTTSDVGWDEASTYVTSFYSHLLTSRVQNTSHKRMATILKAHKYASRTVSQSNFGDCSFQAIKLSN